MLKRLFTTQRRLIRLPAARRTRRRLALLAGLGTLGLLGPALALALLGDPYCYADPAAVPPRSVALVLGAGLINGRPSPALAQRIDGALAIYRHGRVQKFLFSGDNSRVEYDEVSAMRDYAIAIGIPAEAITLDYAGFSTYDSCFRAQAIFGVTDVVVVSQHYHVRRAVYTCRELGLDAVALGMPDWLYDSERLPFRYSAGQQIWYTLRELLALDKAAWQLHVTRPQPTFLGGYEGMR